MCSTTAWVIAITIELILVALRADDSPVVKLPLGKFEGSTKTSVNGRKFFSFEGVPYAQPPVGERRFEEPLPVEPWKGTLSTRSINMCLQYRHLRPTSVEEPIAGNEDCLYLNIYTPNLTERANLDVIVYIHGGAFMFNYGGFQGPEILLEKDIVYVNFNYRLGPLGFLSTEDSVVPGNNGLKDQIMALKFIRDYISYFGGNPNSVTITGNSAGGASVQFHYLIQKSRGLFNRGISQSGTVLNPWVLMENALDKTRKIASMLDCHTNITKEMVQCLKYKPAYQVVETVKSFQPWLYNPFSPFAVVVDAWAKDPLLTKHPYELLRKKQVYDVPWIISHVDSEGLYPAAEFYTKEKFLNNIDSRWNSIIPHILHYNETVTGRHLNKVNDRIRNYYFGDKAVAKESYRNLIQMISDRLYIVDIHKSVKLHADATTKPVYFYYFTYRGQNSRSDSRSQTRNNFGAAHGDDASYIFQMNLDTRSTENDRMMSDLLVNIWLSFAKTGIPKIPYENWLPVSRGDEEIGYLKISSPNNLTMESDRSLGHEQFWNNLPFQENENFYKGRQREEL